MFDLDTDDAYTVRTATGEIIERDIFDVGEDGDTELEDLFDIPEDGPLM